MGAHLALTALLDAREYVLSPVISGSLLFSLLDSTRENAENVEQRLDLMQIVVSFI